MPITAASSHSLSPCLPLALPRSPQVIVARSMRKIECNKIARTGLGSASAQLFWLATKEADGREGEGPGEERELQIIAAISGNSLG